MRDLISLKSILKTSEDQVSCDLGGEAVILSIGEGVYYGLNEVGASVWSMLQEPRSAGEILEALVQEYEVDRDRCQQDLTALLGQMLERKLVTIHERPSE